MNGVSDRPRLLTSQLLTPSHEFSAIQGEHNLFKRQAGNSRSSTLPFPSQPRPLFRPKSYPQKPRHPCLSRIFRILLTFLLARITVMHLENMNTNGPSAALAYFVASWGVQVLLSREVQGWSWTRDARDHETRAGHVLQSNFERVNNRSRAWWAWRWQSTRLYFKAIVGIIFALYGRTGLQTSANASRARCRWRHLVLICEIVTDILISWYLVISGMDAGAKAGSQRRLVLLVVVRLLFSPCHAIVHRTQGSVVSVPTEAPKAWNTWRSYRN